jgi:hypothetical protein
MFPDASSITFQKTSKKNKKKMIGRAIVYTMWCIVFFGGWYEYALFPSAATTTTQTEGVDLSKVCRSANPRFPCAKGDDEIKDETAMEWVKRKEREATTQYMRLLEQYHELPPCPPDNVKVVGYRFEDKNPHPPRSIDPATGRLVCPPARGWSKSL